MDLIQRLTTDHRRFLLSISSIHSLLFGEQHPYFSEGRQPAVTSTVVELVHEVIRTLLRHEAIEQRVLFPALTARLPEIALAIGEINSEHDNTLDLLRDFEKSFSKASGISNHRLIDKFLYLQKHLNAHIIREETEIFEPARAKIPPHELSELGRHHPRSSKEAV